MRLQGALGDGEGSDGADDWADEVDPGISDLAAEDRRAKMAGRVEGGSREWPDAKDGCGQGEADTETTEPRGGFTARGRAVDGKGEEEGGKDFEADDLCCRGIHARGWGAEID